MKFDVLIADPPWRYNNKRTGGSHKSGSAQKYDTLSYLELTELDVAIKMVMKNSSYLFLWTTNPMINESLSLMEDWGYNYKTMLTWDKGRYGMGFWFRSQTEHILFGTRGKVPALRSIFRNIIEEKPKKHSQKPDRFYTMIRTVFPDKKILELFATRNEWLEQSFETWTRIGKDITGNKIEDDLARLIVTEK